MKTAKRASLLLLFLALIGGAVYLPLSRHVVVFQGKSHVVQKDSLGWDHTYLNLDKDPLKWRLVVKSKTLRAYFLKHYRDVMLSKLKQQGGTLWSRFKRSAKQLLKGSAEWVKEQGPKQLKLLKKGAKDGLNVLKAKSNKFLEQHAQ